MRLHGKVALITGAGSGIGKAIALRFAQAGAKLVVADIDDIAANHTVQDIRKYPGEALSLTMDVTDEASVNSGILRASQYFGNIDLLINNAGIQIIESVDKLRFDQWKKMLAVHLDGAFLTTKACLKQMYRQPSGGRILYMGSVHSKEASPLKAPYVTAKHGLEGLCQVVAKEGASHNVSSNLICPGFVRTPLVEQQIPQQAKALHISEKEVIQNIMLKETIDGHFTSMEDVAETALFLAAFPSNALSGQSIIVSHGWHMQ